MGLRELKRSAKQHGDIWKESYKERLKGTRKPTRDIDDVPEVWKEWKLSSQWQENVFNLFQKNNDTPIIDLSGLKNLPKDADPKTYPRDISLFILLFLYCEIPYQMGSYEICLFHKKTKQTTIGKGLSTFEISDSPLHENFLFSKMHAPYGLRNFVMKYLEFAFYMQRLEFKSEYQKNKLIHSLLKELFPADSKYFNQMQYVQMNQIRHYLKGISQKYTQTYNASIITKMWAGFRNLQIVILDDIDNEDPEPIFTPQNLPIYYYYDKYLRLEYCNSVLDDFYYFQEQAREHLDTDDEPAQWLEFKGYTPPPRYFT